MKRLVCAALALTLVGTAAASAQPYGRGGYSHSYRHGGHDNTGALIGLGIGLFALGAIAASQHDYDRDRYEDRGYRGGYYQDRREYQNDYRNSYRGGYQNYQDNGYGYGYR
jgi:hypothetical protein